MNDYQLDCFDFKQRLLLFENWITERFITECEFSELSALDALVWSQALLKASKHVSHEIVQFNRKDGNEQT